MDEEALRRLGELCRSLVAMTPRTEGLEIVDPSGAPSEHACRLRLTSREGALSTLTVSRGQTTVTTLSAGAHPEAGDARITDRLGVDLTEGFVWDAVACASADELAGLLVRHMLRRVKHAVPEPERDSGQRSPAEER